MTETNAVLIGLVLDKSGSMQPQERAVRSGIAELITEQKALDGECRLSLMLFDTTQQVQYVATPIGDIDPATIPYYAHGMTALYDSFAMMIEGLGAWCAKHPEWSGQVKVVVFTDGEENSSRTYSLEAVNDLIGERKVAGWEFIFLGSGGAAWLEGRSMANVAGSTYAVGVGPDAVRGAFRNVTSSLADSRTSGVSMAAGMNAAYGEPDPVEPAAMRGSVKNRVAKTAVEQLAEG